MAKLTNMLKKVFLLLICAFFYSQAADPVQFESGHEWGWGGTTSGSNPEIKTAEIPYFDQDIGQHLLKKEFRKA